MKMKGLLRGIMGLGVLTWLLAGCGADGTATAVPPPATETAAPAPPAAPTNTARPPEATPAPPAVKPELYDHAPDYSWIAGQVRQEGDCWIVAYVSPLTLGAPDEYNNQLTLLGGGGWNPADFSSGAWVIAYGQPQAGSDPAPGCAAHGYMVTRVELNPKTPKASDTLR
jgi:hypothetical protein